MTFHFILIKKRFHSVPPKNSFSCLEEEGVGLQNFAAPFIVSLSRLVGGLSCVRGFFLGGGRGMEIFPGNLFHLHFIPKSVCSALPRFPSLAHTSAPETARNSSQATPSHGSGVERRGTAGLLQGAAVRFRCWSPKFPGRIACLFP